MKFSMRSAARESMVRRGFIGAVLLAVLLSGGMASGVGNDPADAPQVQIPATGMKSGHLTDKGDKSAEINGKDYAFHSKIEFADDSGQTREWKEFRKGDQIQYHLKQERIDVLVLELPK